jgi:hypothetical protein
MGYLPRRETWRIGDPDVALAFIVENPRHPRHLPGSDEFRRKWRAKQLLDRESFGKTRPAQKQHSGDNGKISL